MKEFESKDSLILIGSEKYLMPFGSDGVEIGGDSANFEGINRLSRWNKERTLSFEPRISLLGKTKLVTADTITLADEDIELRWYKRKPWRETVPWLSVKPGHPGMLMGQNGSLEMAIYLTKPPPFTSLDFNIEHSGLRGYYQPALDPIHPTWKTSGTGMAFRPWPVVGSWAFYHDSKKNGGYKTGKAFHLYALKITTADLKVIYVPWESEIIDGVLRARLPDMTKLKYPIIIDPTFGYEEIGDTDVYASYLTVGSHFTMGGTEGEIDYFWCYSDYQATEISCMALYNYASPAALQGYSVNYDDALHADCGVADKWWRYEVHANSDPISLAASTEYWILHFQEDAWDEIRFDSGDSGKGVYCRDYQMVDETSWPATEDFSDDLQSRLYSVYIVYTEGGAGPQELTAAAVAVSSSVITSTVSGDGDAPLTQAVISVASSVVNSVIATRQDLTANIVSVASSVITSTVSGSGDAPLTGAVVSVASSVVSSTIATTQILTQAVISVSSSVVASAIAGTGDAPLSQAIVGVASSVQISTISGSGDAPLTAAVVSVASSVQVATISGSGVAPLTGAVVSVASSVVQASISGSGIALLTGSVVAVASSVVTAGISGLGTVVLTAAVVAVASSVVGSSISVTDILTRFLTLQLYDRSLTANLYDRSLTAQLQDRSLTAKLYDRSLTASLPDRSLTLKVSDER